jgi:hypothetical protein
MNRRTVFMLTGMTLLGWAIAAFPPLSFAQSDPFIGTWQLNLAKSKYSPGPPPKSVSVNFQAEGQNHKLTTTGINAEGKPILGGPTRIYDGMPHPVTGNPAFDAVTWTRVDPFTVIFSRTKAGKLVQIETNVVSQDGRTAIDTVIGTDANGRPINNVGVYDKQ